MSEKDQEKKEYFLPKIVHTEHLTARATTCAKSDDAACGAGPLHS